MKPLRETHDPSIADEHAAAELLSKLAPFEANAALRRQVRLALDAERGTRRAPYFRPVLVVLSLCAATAAAAKVGGIWHESAEPAPAPNATAVHVAASAPLTPAAAPTAMRQPEASSRPLPSTPRSSSTGEPARTSPRNSAASAASAETGPGARLMIEAMQARRAGNLARAAELVAEYRRQYPSGALQEEALAVSMEAANASGDQRTAGELARQYLAQYPGGRFSGQARRISSPAGH